jgi:hypothetical protein
MRNRHFGTILLIITQIVERFDYRTDLLSVSRIWVDVRKAVNERHKVGTKFPLQVIDLLRQLLSVRGVSLLVYLIIQLSNFAVRLGLKPVAADFADYFLCIRLKLSRVRLLSLGIQRRR